MILRASGPVCIALDLVGLGSVMLARVAGNLVVLVVFDSFGESPLGA